MELDITFGQRMAMIVTFFIYTVAIVALSLWAKRSMDKAAVDSYVEEFYTGGRGLGVLAVIAGIISLGREIIAEDEKQKDIIDTVPMVMDAPISSFDSDRVNSFSETIPQIAEQLILLLKNPEAEIVKIKMNKKIGKLYRITNSENGNSTCSVIEKLEA